MKLLIVRHGDPDYTIDSLTEKGWKEAEYLSENLISKIFMCHRLAELRIQPLSLSKR